MARREFLLEKLKKFSAARIILTFKDSFLHYLQVIVPILSHMFCPQPVSMFSVKSLLILSYNPVQFTFHVFRSECFTGVLISGVPRGVLGRVQNPPPEIPKALQNGAKFNPVVKTVKNC